MVKKGGFLLGKVLIPRVIASYGRPHWSGVELVKMVATALGESDGYVGAYNDNGNGTRDCGLMQINIPTVDIGTTEEFKLRTTSPDYDAVVKTNVASAYRLYENPGPNNGLRRWGPWFAYTDGWATLPAWWTWKHNADGEGVGPWQRTGRYVQRAIVGVANYHLVLAKDMTPDEALALARELATHFRVEGTLGVQRGIVGWTKLPAIPTAPPADGEGPRPIVNSGL